MTFNNYGSSLCGLSYLRILGGSLYGKKVAWSADLKMSLCLAQLLLHICQFQKGERERGGLHSQRYALNIEVQRGKMMVRMIMTMTKG